MRFEEENQFKLAKNLHSRSPLALEQICFNFLGATWPSWVFACNFQQKNLFDNIPKSLRNALLAHLTRSEKWNWAKPELHLLLNSETKEVDLDKWKLKPKSGHEVVRFFENLVCEAPNLEKVSLGDKANFIEDGPFHFFGDLIIHQVYQLKNLRYLSLNRACFLTRAQFVKITKKLKKLVCLKVQLKLSVSVDALSHLKSLKQLEEFHFSFWGCEDYFDEDKNRATEEFYSWCGQNLPRLKLIAGTFEDCLCRKDDWEDHKSLVHQMSPQFSGVSDLETLHAEFNLPEASLPKLKKFFCYGAGGSLSSNFFLTLSSYQNLTHFGVNYIEWHHLVQILECIGQRLSHLFYDLDMEEDEGTIDQYQLFHLCPNLVSHEQIYSYDTTFESPFKSSVSKLNFRNLQECMIGEVSSDLFEMICQAPSIKSIWCFYFTVSKEHCLAVDSVKPHFNNLEQFKLINLRGFTNDCSMKDVEEMVKKVVCSAPKLKDIEVHWRDDSDCRDKWETSGAVKFIKLIEKHAG